MPYLGELKIGNKYFNRCGEEVIIEKRSDKDYAFMVRRLTFVNKNYSEDYWPTYHIMLDGGYTRDGSSAHDFDIIPEIKNLVTPVKNQKNIIRQFPVGADPELVIRNDIGCLHAENILDNGVDKKYSYGSYGVDGCKSIMEIRPTQSENPMDVVRNIQKLFRRACIDNPILVETKWMAGASKIDVVGDLNRKEISWAIGGHIHFGITQKNFMAIMLDHYLAAFYLLTENYHEGLHRIDSKSYGHLTDVRRQKWGFEYRTLSSWLSSPGMASAVLSLAKHIINQFRISNNVIFNDPVLRNYLAQSILNEYENHNEKFFRTMFEENWHTVMSWPVEPKLKSGLLLFEDYIKSGFKSDDRDIKKAWGIHANIG